MAAALCAPTVLDAGEIAPPLTPSSSGPTVFDDEFNGPAGAAPDTARWDLLTGGGGWGSGELGVYTTSRANSYLDGDGHLVIVVRRGSSDPRYPYTSARLASRKVVGPYFRAEARIKVTTEYGLWSCFWLLGGPPKVDTAVWPRKGEIDAMEVIGKLPTTTFATPHGYSTDPNTKPAPNAWFNDTQLDTHEDLSAGFHTWTVEARKDQITWWFDGRVIKTFTRSQLPTGAVWSMDNPMHVILNVGVGGFFAEAPNASTVLPARMVVDYVRVTSVRP